MEEWSDLKVLSAAMVNNNEKKNKRNQGEGGDVDAIPPKRRNWLHGWPLRLRPL